MLSHANTFITKITYGCNLRCKYCYVHDKDTKAGKHLKPELFYAYVDKIIAEKLKNDTLKGHISFVFHGGEPLLGGKILFSKILHYASKKFGQYGFSPQFSLQTNATLIDDIWIRLFKKYDVRLGISLDGIGEGNAARTKKYDSDYFFNTMKKLDDANVHYNLLMVANKINIRTVVADTKKLHAFKESIRYKINYVEDVDNTGIGVSAEEFFTFVRKPLLEQFFETGEFKESNIENVINKFFTSFVSHTIDVKTHCTSKFCGGGHTICALDMEGNILFCGRWDEKDPQSLLSTVTQKDFLNLKQISKYMNLAREKNKDIIEKNCDICKAQDICDYGCAAFSKTQTGKIGISSVACELSKLTYDFLMKNQEKVIESIFKYYARSKNVSKIPAFYGVSSLKKDVCENIFENMNIKITSDQTRWITMTR
jgi:uncharacterized protein